MNVKNNTYNSLNTNSNDFKNNNQILINQKALKIEKHYPKIQYRILSKNDFGKVPTRINVGIFNKKTDFRVSEDHSLMVFNKKECKIESKSIPEIQKDIENYFLIYRYIPADEKFINNKLRFEFQKEDKILTIDLNESLGWIIGDILYNIDFKDLKSKETFYKYIENYLKTGSNPELPEIIKYFFEFKKNEDSYFKDYLKISISKYIIYNSNPRFLTGILAGFFKNNYNKIPKFINIYSFSNILNYLGASYSIRNNKISEENKDSAFMLRYKLPYFIYKMVYTKNSIHEFLPKINNFRKVGYRFLPKKIGTFENFELKFIKDLFNIEFLLNKSEEFYNKKLINDFQKEINEGKIELIPCEDLVFQLLPEAENKDMLDMTMENINAQNYNLPGLGYLKNSDGDIMMVTALMTKEAAIDGDREHSPSNKKKFISPATGEVFNWAVKNDAQYGIYNATK